MFTIPFTILLFVTITITTAKPNILILFADDLGSGDLSTYGHPTTSTPNLDALAFSGIKFTQWYSGFHVCSPSRGSMMTGRLPIRLGLAGDKWTGGVFNSDAIGGLPLNETTIAETLRALGYKTKAIGKWHLGQQPKYLPTNQGFDSYYGIPYSDDMGSSAWDLYNNADRPPLPLIRSDAPLHLEVIEQPTDLNLLSARYVNESITFITDSVENNDNWFLYMAFNHVHVPDFVSPTFCNTTRRGLFGDALAELDSAIGEIIHAVVNVGVDNNTIIFFTSDNGPWLIKKLAGGSAGLLRDGKTTTWEGGIREPGIIRWTNHILPNRISKEVVATYDIFTTAIALAGGTVPSDRIIDGVDLSELLLNKNWNDDVVGGGLVSASGGVVSGGVVSGGVVSGGVASSSSSSSSGSAALHKCLYHYKGTPNLNCPNGNVTCPGLWAVRCGAYKLHYVTSNWTTGSSNGEFHNPPLIYQIEYDPGENYPLDVTTTEYKQAKMLIENEVAMHRKNLKIVPNQMALGKDPALRICCSRMNGTVGKKATSVNGRQEMGDQENACNCNPENFKVFVCTDGGENPIRL